MPAWSLAAISAAAASSVRRFCSTAATSVVGSRFRPTLHSGRRLGLGVVGEVTGSPADPRTLLLGRYDDQDRLQYVGRTTTLAQAAGAAVAGLLAPGRDHPWTGWSFSAGWGRQEKLVVTLVWNPSWWWKSASTSLATPPAGGDIPHAGIVPAPTSPPPMSPA